MPHYPRRRVARLALAAAAAATPLLFPLPPARATDISWSTPTSGRWLDPTRWSTGTVPTSTDSVTIDAPSATSYTVTVDANVSAGPVTLDSPAATLLVTNPFGSTPPFSTTSLTLSAGTLALHSTGDTLNVLTHALTNTATLTLDADSVPYPTTAAVYFNTGARPFTNYGTIEAHAAPAPAYPAIYYLTSTTYSPIFTNIGTLRTTGNAKLFLNHYTLNQNAGSLDGDVQLSSGTLNFNGGSCSPDHPVSLYNSTLNLAPAATDGNFFLYTNATLNTDIPAGNTISTSCYAAVAWNPTAATPASVTNDGHLLVGYYNYGQYSSSAGGPTTPASLELPSSSTTLLNTGTLEINNPAYRAASLTGSITNNGAVAIHAPSTAAPTIVSGSFTQNAGGSLTIDPATSLSLSGSHFDYNGGTVSGPVTLNNSTVHFAPSLTAAGGTFTYSAATATSVVPFTGDIPAGVTVVHAGNTIPYEPSYDLAPFTNAGSLRTDQMSGALFRPVYNLTPSPGTLTNTGSLGGTVTGVDHGISLQLVGNLTNTGDIKAYNLLVTNGTFDQDAGTLVVDRLCITSHGTFNYNGGTLTGKPVALDSSTLDIAPNTQPARFTFYAGDCILHGDITHGTTVSLNSAFGVSASSVSVTADPFSNAGTLSLAATYGDTDSTLTVTGSGTLTNTGTLSVTLGQGGTRTLNANVANTGTLSIGPGATLTLTGSLSTTTPLDLQGTLDLRTGGPLTWSYTGPSPADTLRSLLASSHLTDSAADSNHRLAYADTFSGEPTAPTSSLTVTLALTGDTNLDGKITPDDYALLDRSYASSLPDAHWTDGDFNYDGLIDQNDYLLIDTIYLQQQGGTTSPSFLSLRESQFGDAYVSTLLASIPEPASLSLSSCSPPSSSPAADDAP